MSGAAARTGDLRKNKIKNIRESRKWGGCNKKQKTLEDNTEKENLQYTIMRRLPGNTSKYIYIFKSLEV